MIIVFVRYIVYRIFIVINNQVALLSVYVIGWVIIIIILQAIRIIWIFINISCIEECSFAYVMMRIVWSFNGPIFAYLLIIIMNWGAKIYLIYDFIMLFIILTSFFIIFFFIFIEVFTMKIFLTIIFFSFFIIFIFDALIVNFIFIFIFMDYDHD